MNYIIREKIFNKIMVIVRKLLYFLLKLDIHKKFCNYENNDSYFPVMSYSIKDKKYRFNCYCLTCSCNNNGLCVSKFFKIPTEALHEFDGDNIIKNYCG